MMQPHELLERIRELAGRDQLRRVHRGHPALYARARRLFGSWATALGAAGIDHGETTTEARRRGPEARRRVARADRCGSGIRTRGDVVTPR